jgi:hypothetical protein
VENRNPNAVDDKEEEIQDAEYGDVPSMSTTHTEIDTAQIKPTGTGCRMIAILILIISAVLGLVYFYNQSQSHNQPTPSNAPPGQTQQ